VGGGDFGAIWNVRGVNLAVLAWVSRAATKRKDVNFFKEKCAPPEKILATPI